MKPNTKTQKEMALKLLKKLDIFQPYIDGFKENNQVCFYENYAGFWICQEPAAFKKMKEIEQKYGCTVYAATHEFTKFGELYSFLIVTKYKEEWTSLIKSHGNEHSVFAYVWNQDDNFCSEFGSIVVRSLGGGIKRIE